MKKELDTLHNHFVLFPADKAEHNIAFVCKARYLNLFLKNLDLILQVAFELILIDCPLKKSK